MRSKQYFTSIKNNPHEISTDPFLRNELCTFVVNRMFPYESSNVYIDNKLHGHLWNVV